MTGVQTCALPICPEDLEFYEGLVPAVKLATRVNKAPARVLHAYINRRYRGSVMELLEPDHSGLLFPSIVDNSEIPRDFGKSVFECDKNCSACGKCIEAMERATKTIDFEIYKV